MIPEYGIPLPIEYGKNRVSGVLLWYGDFRVVEHKPGNGIGGGTLPSYAYCADLIWKKPK